MNITHYEALDETLYSCRLDNGLQLMVVPRKGFSRRLAYFVTDYGSIHTRFTLDGVSYETPAGVAHYLEHKLFDMPGDRDVSQEFAALGASVNAFTSYDMTAYYFACTENFDPCLKLLLEFVSTPYFTAESVEKEKGIIDQEISMTADSPENRMYENLMARAYQVHPVKTPILGTGDSIREITPEILALCHRAFYAPGNMMLCVVGDVYPEHVKAIAQEVLGTENPSVGQKEGAWPEPLASPERLIEDRMEVAMPMFHLVFKAEPCGKGPQGVRRELVADLAAELLFGESSELYLKLYEQGLIDSSFGGAFENIDGCAMLSISGDSRDPQAVRTAVFTQTEKLLRGGLTQEYFLRMKRSTLGRRIRGLDSFDATCFRLCAYRLEGFDYFAFPEIYSQIEKEELLAFLAQVIRRENSCLSIIYPMEA